jgi:DNA-binding response OmpR family regulator
MKDCCPQCGFDPRTDTLEDVHFIYAERMVFRFGVGVKLSQPEIDLFEALFDAGDKGCTTAQLIHAVYGHKLECDVPDDLHTNTYVYISKVRAKLRKIGLLISHNSRGCWAGKYYLTRMRALSPEHAMQMEAAQ